MDESYCLIRQRQQYALGYTAGQNDNNFNLQLFRLDKLQIVSAFGIQIQQYWNKSCKNSSKIKNWFEGIDDLVKYIKQGSQKMVRVWAEKGKIDILVQARKGKDKYVKIGQIQLQQVCVSKKMQLVWIIQQCNKKECLNAQQILCNVRNMYRIYLQLINMPLAQRQQQQKNDFDPQNMLEIIDNIQKSLDLVQECFDSQVKRILTEFDHKISIVNTKLQNCQQIQNNQTSTCKLQYWINKSQENTQLTVQSEIKNDISRQKQNENTDINSYVNTKAEYFKHFKTNGYQITLIKNPGSCYCFMFCGYPIETETFKYSIKIIRMQKKIALGIARASSAYKMRCRKKHQMITYSNKGHFTYQLTKTNKSKYFSVGDIVSVCVNFAEGLIFWSAKETILYKYSIELLKIKQIVWMPYIQLIGQGDTVEWVSN